MFNSSKSAKEALFFSKLAILELCGWIEESMDDVVLRCASRHIKLDANRKYVKKQVVDRTYGFEYERHFRHMLVQIIGIIKVERLERNVDQTKLLQLRATLSNLESTRNSEAHTHIKGITRKMNAPSVTLTQFPVVYEGLLEYEKAISKLSF